jgi:outer membrane immunogenic protein
MKIKLLAGIAAAAIVTSGSAFAADMPLKAPAPVALYDWSGFYIGGFVGGGWFHNDEFDPDVGFSGLLFGVPLATAVSTTTTGSGFIGGIEGGDRYQFGKLVIGWEADMAWGNVDNTTTIAAIPPGVGGVTISRTLNDNLKWTGTATSSVGIAHDRWLVYGKAGIAWARFEQTASSSIFGPGVGGTFPLFAATSSEDRVGWTVGTGVEWAIWNNWSIKAEYDYIDFGTKTTVVSGTLTPTVFNVPVTASVQNTLHEQQFKFGLNWHIMPNIW